MPKPPEQPPLLLSLTMAIPTVVALLAVAGVIGLPLGWVYRAGQDSGPVPLQAHQEQHWTANPGLPVAVASLAARGALPPPDPRQKPAPCDDELGEEDIGGACWQRLPVAKCNERKAFPYNGRCYLRVMQVAPLPREPTSGEGRQRGVADP